MNATSPKSSLAKLGLLYPKQKTLKVMVLGQSGVGKSAMVVRFITKRYIGEYDPTLEKIYTFHTVMDNEAVYFDILDTAGQTDESECLALEANIKWAEAFILMYSVTDKCSFDECYRLKFLINYNKRRRRLGGSSSGSSSSKDGIGDIPVVLVGNKIDQIEDRMVTSEEGQKRSKEIGCVCFHEISVRESIEQVWAVFRDVCRFWRVQNKNPSRLLKTSSSSSSSSTSATINDKEPMISPDSVRLLCSTAVSPGSLLSGCRPSGIFSRRWTEVELEEEDESESKESTSASSPSEAASQPFRERASTDGHLQHKPWRWRYPPPSSSTTGNEEFSTARADRRMSISMRGSNNSY